MSTCDTSLKISDFLDFQSDTTLSRFSMSWLMISISSCPILPCVHKTPVTMETIVWNKKLEQLFVDSPSWELRYPSARRAS
jgi:hypothetical protein